MIVIKDNPVHIIADDGFVLTDGDIQSKEVWLGIYDSIDNWKEIEEPEGGEENAEFEAEANQS